MAWPLMTAEPSTPGVSLATSSWRVSSTMSTNLVDHQAHGMALVGEHQERLHPLGAPPSRWH